MKLRVTLRLFYGKYFRYKLQCPWSKQNIPKKLAGFFCYKTFCTWTFQTFHSTSLRFGFLVEPFKWTSFSSRFGLNRFWGHVEWRWNQNRSGRLLEYVLTSVDANINDFQFIILQFNYILKGAISMGNNGNAEGTTRLLRSVFWNMNILNIRKLFPESVLGGFSEIWEFHTPTPSISFLRQFLAPCVCCCQHTQCFT